MHFQSLVAQNDICEAFQTMEHLDLCATQKSATGKNISAPKAGSQTVNGPKNGPIIVWFRSDLRLSDNLALWHASQTDRPIIAVYILQSHKDIRQMGGASKWWLHHSLQKLAQNLREKHQIELILRRGDPEKVLVEIIEETKPSQIYWNRRYTHPHMQIDTQLKDQLVASGIEVHSYNCQLLHEPAKLKTGAGGPYRVYSPMWRALFPQLPAREIAPSPEKLIGFDKDLQCEKLEDWDLLPTTPDWAGGMREEWNIGEEAAKTALSDFLDAKIHRYKKDRDFAGIAATSRMSPHLHFGEISPNQIWAAVEHAEKGQITPDSECYKKEVVWREFSYHLLYHYPKIGSENYQPKFDHFDWRDPSADQSALDDLTSWQKGLTGYPIVDAGMRELWHTGYMHNRVRMITASFLIKHLLIHWKNGENWFWDTLVDADEASNSASWQWVAGSGADAAPYFRIFNPITQGQKFDTDGAYVRKWVPELKDLADKYIHQPWTAEPATLNKANIKLGQSYPNPIVEHKFARERALQALQSLPNNQNFDQASTLAE